MRIRVYYMRIRRLVSYYIVAWRSQRIRVCSYKSYYKIRLKHTNIAGSEPIYADPCILYVDPHILKCVESDYKRGGIHTFSSKRIRI